jgi:signal peptidase I
MEGRTILTSDDHTLGTVIGERDDCVIIETGHVLKTKHALPSEFIHEVDGQLRATVPKSAVDDSPKVDLDDWDCSEIKRHYGLEGGYVRNPDPEESAELDAQRLGVNASRRP